MPIARPASDDVMRHELVVLMTFTLAAGCNHDALEIVTGDAAAGMDLAASARLDLAPPPSTCRQVEVRFAPGSDGMQIAAWIEDAKGHYVDTVYVTRATGQFGLANRPGDGLLKTDFKWPYGRREMVLPVWAHRRNHHYPRIVMGGACGNSASTKCPDGTPCAGDCDDNTITYHSRVSSYEPYYCGPGGASRIDAMSCASSGTFSKGAYAGGNAISLYPPRADLSQIEIQPGDGPDAKDFAARNDLVAISRATPPRGAGGPLQSPPVWDARTQPDGDYAAWIELSQESDFNPHHNYPNHHDAVMQWDFEGHPFLGQPSVLYRVPFRLDADGGRAATTDYAGYGSWDGGDGDLRPPDGTITTGKDGSGAGRLRQIDDGAGLYRLKVVAGSCP